VPDLATPDRPLRIAIVGSGPSGFYAVDALQKAPPGPSVEIDIFDRLPTPYGLVRGGVAPDHPRIKNVTRVYEKIASRKGVRFLGNVRVGRDITVRELGAHYDAVIFCSGAEADRKLGIPGEDLTGSHGAVEFVGWYNGHPDHRHRGFDLSHEVAVVVGQGNVASDVTRMLLRTADELRKTDVAAHAFEALAESNIREVHLIGRRGPAQAKFTPAEMREFGRLEACDPSLDPAFLKHSDACLDEIAGNKDALKNIALLEEWAYRPPQGKRRRLFIHFFESPVELRGDGRLQEVVLERNRLVGEPGRQRAVGTGEMRLLECGLFFRAIGFKGVPVPEVPFDENRGVFPNDAGRILENGRPVPGLYAAGWIKRGPSGTIGTNKADSAETVASLLADLGTLRPCLYPGAAYVDSLLAARGIRVVSFDDWRKIDAAEVRRGAAAGKPREKGTTVDELLGFLE